MKDFIGEANLIGSKYTIIIYLIIGVFEKS